MSGIDAVSALHVPSHAYCLVCDKDRDVEAVGNAFPCDHYASFCRECDRRWPCRTYRAIAEPTPHVCQFCMTPLADHWWDPCTYTPGSHQGDPL